MKRILIFVLLLLALGLAACGDEDSATGGAAPSESDGPPGPPKTISFKVDGKTVKRTEPEVSVPDGPPPDKLIAEDLIEGEGVAAKEGDVLSVQFVVHRYIDGEFIESSWGWGKPFTFELGSGESILGWEKNLPGMKVGGRRHLVVPGQLSAPNGISPFANPEELALVYVIDLIKVK